MNLQLVFGKAAKRSQDKGPNDAGVQHYTHNIIKSLARETIQNIIDVWKKNGKPVQALFELLKLQQHEIPDIGGMIEAYRGCHKYLKDRGASPTVLRFYENAIKLAQQKQISVLRISDRNTTGVCGNEKGTSKSKQLYHLVFCEGGSSKSDGEGGSFGIGRKAALGASQLATIIYSSYNEDQQHMFVCSTTLTTHDHPDGGKSDNVGYVLNEDDTVIRNPGDIPEKFLRVTGDIGTDICIVGFPDEEIPSWAEDIKHAILDDFLIPINAGNLEVTIRNDGKNTLINQDTLYTHVKELKIGGELPVRSSSKSIQDYYECLTSPEAKVFEENLPYLGYAILRLLVGKNRKMSKRIYQSRLPGMKICEKSFHGADDFCGILQVLGNQGNLALKTLERPAHDDWDFKNNRKIEVELVKFIRMCISKGVHRNDKPGEWANMHRYLPMQSNEEEVQNGGVLVKTQKISNTEPKKIQSPEPNKTIKPKRFVMPEAVKVRWNKENIEKKKKLKIPKSQLHVPHQPIPINYRTFMTSDGVYTVLVSPQYKASQEKEVVLDFRVAGETGTEPVEIKNAHLFDGTNLTVTEIRNTSSVSPVKFSNNEPVKLEIVLQEPLCVAMEIIAYEN